MVRSFICLLVVMVVANCAGRPLAEGERAFASDLFGSGMDLDAVRIAAATNGEPLPKPPPLPTRKKPRKIRPGICDRVNPTPRAGPPPAFAVYNQVKVTGEFYRPDMLPGWPDDILLPHVLLMGHELVHVWQWQNRARTGYRPARAALESLANGDPYFYVPEKGSDFLDYGFEQQASLVEDFLCYGLFDPENPRRTELRGILAPYFNVDRINAILKQ